MLCNIGYKYCFCVFVHFNTKQPLEGLFTDFTRGPAKLSPVKEYRILKAFLFFSIPTAATVDFILSWIVSIAPLLVDRFGPICDTIKWISAATGIENIENVSLS